MGVMARRPRVLLADDYPALHKALTRLLSPYCDVVGQASGATELLESVKRVRPDVVVFDVSMPGIDGLGACRHMKAMAPDLDVVVFTSDDDADLRADVFEAGASAFILKFRGGNDLVPAILKTRPRTPVYPVALAVES